MWDSLIGASRRLEKLLRWLRCWFTVRFQTLFGWTPSVNCWLTLNPNVQAAVSWQHDYSGTAYQVHDAVRHRHVDWSTSERAELQSRFAEAWTWLQSGGSIADPATEGITYPPTNLKDTSNDAAWPFTNVDDGWAWDFYLRWTALSLAVEIGAHVPWTVVDYNIEELRILFDSNSMMVKLPGAGYALANGFSEHGNYVTRDQNRGSSMPGPPRHSYTFLRDGAMIGASRLVTIHAFLTWISNNCAHFYGAASYQESDNHWQYRGLPPIPRVLAGTTNPTVGTPPGQFNHWTAGCHGTTGLIRNVLRAVNIPVTISRVCGHSQAIFTSEGPLYLDHGDNLYNSDFTSSGLPVSDVLIGHTTYVSWFGTGTDNRDEGCANIGRQVTELTA